MDTEVMARLQAHVETLNIQELQEAADAEYFYFLQNGEGEEDKDPYNEGWF
ncbi:hypothetical protein V8U11_16060 [Pseudomonas chlororaphis]|uniref:hypothetical protein n=1 Tax=Pseudomonas chlororaphis TaxID=587753 RepID=UPI0030D5E891